MLFDDSEPFYVNKEGLYVFTEQYLLQRGYCCGNGCKHCPFDYKNVLDSLKRQKLLNAREKRNNREGDRVDE